MRSFDSIALIFSQSYAQHCTQKICTLRDGYFVASCNQDENLDPSLKQDQIQSEIARIEKEKGIVFFKRDVVFEDGGNIAVLRVATENEAVFENIVEKFEITINPIYSDQSLISSSESGIGEEGKFDALGTEILTEFIQLRMENDVIGFSTNFNRSKLNGFSNGRVEGFDDDYQYYVTHYSMNWPSRFWLDFPQQGGGVFFQCKRKWYNGWESDTNCIISSTFGNFAGQCGNTHHLYGSNAYVFNVDGPYQVRAKIGTWATSAGWTWGFVR